MMNIEQLKLVIFTAFLGNIDDNVRALAFDFTERKIIIYGYLKHKPCDCDYESIDNAITEIMASYPNFTEQDIILIETHESIGKLSCYKGWIFARKE